MPYYWVFSHDASTGQALDPFRVEAARESDAIAQAAARGLAVDSVQAVPVLQLIGYWARDGLQLPYPHPVRLVRRSWRAEDRERIVAYLRSGHIIRPQLGYSFCRFACGIPNREMGDSERTDGEWVWPEGLPHYVEAHSVCLPEEFVATMASRGWRAPAELGLIDEDLVDESFWVAWGAQFSDMGAE
jgi:hypothetical protein